jgi:gamma-polyglutamate biosynthesis protein CapA
MINKILIIISAIAIIITWGFFSFFWPDNFKLKTIRIKENNMSEVIEKTSAITATNNFINQLPANSGKENEKINFLFFGDLMLDRHVGEKITKYGLDNLFANLDTSAKGMFLNKDFIGANLEGAATDKGVHYPPNNAYDFAFAPDLINGLKKYNFNFFNLANNHLADQGERGIIETENNLKKLEFNFAGCTDGQVGECSYKVIEIKRLPAGQADYKVGMAGFSLVYNAKKFDTKRAEKIIVDLASTTDLVIVNMHWGVEYEHKFNSIQQEIAHKLVDAGADIIIGHHPHVVQGMEIYESRLRTTNADHANEKVRSLIFYSLGNFVFDQYFSTDTQEELAVGFEWSKEPIQPYLSQKEGKMIFTLLPMKSKASQPELMDGKEKEKFLEKFADWSEVSDDFKKQIKEGRISL